MIYTRNDITELIYANMPSACNEKVMKMLKESINEMSEAEFMHFVNAIGNRHPFKVDRLGHRKYLIK